MSSGLAPASRVQLGVRRGSGAAAAGEAAEEAPPALAEWVGDIRTVAESAAGGPCGGPLGEPRPAQPGGLPLPCPTPFAVGADGWVDCGPALKARVEATSGEARALTLRLPHGEVQTPIFMPVGTQGTIKGLTPEELRRVNCRILLGNTYHLGTRPGGDTLERMGHLHEFMGWDRCILTDSGGFQMVSLLHLAEITEEGVSFKSPVDGSMLLLRPETSMHLQNQIGADIMMALDDVVDSKTIDRPRFETATARTIRWFDRCLSAHARPEEQNLFAIMQGGLDTEPGGLREQCLAGLLRRDPRIPGYAIGGLAGGEDKAFFWRAVRLCCAALPAHKPRYLMGVGFPLDLVVCSALGVDMYDCVFPTRTARFGVALVPGGQLKLRTRGFASDELPVDPECDCPTCSSYSRAYLHHLIRHAESNAASLLSQHNIAYMLRLSARMREAVLEDRYAAFSLDFLREYFPDSPRRVPQWVVDALASVDILVPTTQRWDGDEGAGPVDAAPGVSAAGGASLPAVDRDPGTAIPTLGAGQSLASRRTPDSPETKRVRQ